MGSRSYVLSGPFCVLPPEECMQRAERERLRTVSLRMSPRLVKLVQERAGAEHQSFSALVRDALLRRVVEPLNPRRRTP